MAKASKAWIGRKRELGELEVGLDDAMGGTGGLFVLVGEPGIGKTRFADEVAKTAKERGFTVHWGRCWEVGGAPAFWPWIQIFRSMLRDPRSKDVASAYSDVLKRLLPELRGEAKGAIEDELDGAQARFRLFDELWSLLRATAEQSPLLLVVDDLHAADPSSLSLLQFVARDVRDHRVVVLTSYRDRDARPAPDVAEALRALTKEGSFLPLGRLTLDETRELLCARSGRALAPEMARALHAATEGNPLFVDQVYRMIEMRHDLGSPVLEVPIPEGIREMIQSRLGTLDDKARALLEIGAVVGREFPRALLAAVDGEDDSSLRAPLRAALDAGVLVEPVLGAYEFAHALFREAVYRDLDATRRAELHARVAHVLETSSAPERALGEIAQHLLAAATVVGKERALEGALRAARRAARVLAFEDAATIVENAIQGLLPEPPARARALALLAEMRCRTGEHPAAQAAAEESAAIARRLADPTLLAEAALALGAELAPGTITASLVALLEEAKNTLPSAPTAQRARVLARLAAATQPAENPEAPIELAREALAMAHAVGDDATLRACLYTGGSALVDFADPGERRAWDGELLRLSEQAGDVMASLRAHSRLFFDYLELGRASDADVHLEAHAELAERAGLPVHRWLTLLQRALRATWEGRFDDAMTFREQARRAIHRPDVLTRVAFLLNGWGIAHAKGEPLPDVEEVKALASRFPAAIAIGTAIEGFVRMTEGDLEGARRVTDVLTLDGPALSTFGPQQRYLVEVFAALGDIPRSAALYRYLLPYEGRFLSWGRVGMTVEGPVSWLLGIGASAMGEWDLATRHFEDALVRCRLSGMRCYEAITNLAYARMLARRDGPTTGRFATLVERGQAIAVELGMSGIANSFDALVPLAQSTERAPPPAPPVPPTSAALRAAQGAALALRRDGELWAIECAGGRTLRLKDSRGMHMLAHLVQHPDREFHVLTLMGAEGAADLGDAGEILDRNAAEAYREHIVDLRRELYEAESFGDTGRAAALRRDLELVARELSAGVGLGGRSRRAGSAAERARVNVQRRLREAIRRIGELDAPLGRFLGQAVRTGTFCAYEP